MRTYGLAPYRGDTHRWRFLLWADPGRTVAVDLTGVAVKAEIRSAPGGTFVAALGCTVTRPNTQREVAVDGAVGDGRGGATGD